MSNKRAQFVVKPLPEDQGWQNLTNFLASNESKTMTVTIEPGEPKTRKLSENGLQAVWIKEIAQWQGESEHNVRLWVKAKIGLPILCQDIKTEDEAYRAKRIMWTLKKIGYFDMPDEKKMQVIDLFDVTSAMTTRQHTHFRNQMQAYYGNMGLILESR